METLGNNLKKIRKCSELTQRALAEQLHSSQQYISRLERGSANMSVAFLLDLLDARDTPFEELTEGITR